MTKLAEFEDTGRLWLRGLLAKNELEDFVGSFHLGGKPGLRLKLTKSLQPLLGRRSNLAKELAIFGVSSTPVRLVSFDKSDEANWGVPWHQDRIIAVKKTSEVEGYRNWVRKTDFWHCEPPLSLLSRMLFVRIHVDPCNASNGAMEIAIGSHKHGLIKSCDASGLATSCPIETCEAEAGDVLILKALILHRSGVATNPNRRRALRVDYAKRNCLHPRLEWAIASD